MSALDALLDSSFAYHLGWTLLHFLWQGVLVAAIYACLRSYLADAAPQARYNLSLATLAVLAALPVVTFIYLMGTPVAIHAITGYAAGAHDVAAPAQPSLMDSLRTLLRPLVPWTVPAWSIGVALLGFKSFAGWYRARMLTRQASHSAPAAWQGTVTRLAGQVGVRMHVRLMVTARVTVPCVVGWLKPVILLPPAALSGLSTLQLEMVLAHELSHIRRHDYLVNLLQVAVETLLFYHPAVRWVSRDARLERELCCDDSAVHACGDHPLHYAHALTDLAALRRGDLSPAMGITGGDLTLRVERLISPHHAASPRLASVMLASALCLSGLLALASARNLPLPINQGMVLPVPQLLESAVKAVGNLAVRQPLAPTRIQALMPRPATAEQLSQDDGFAAATLQTVAAPAAPVVPAPVAEAPPEAGPVHIGGAPLSTLLSMGSVHSQFFDISKHSAAPMKVLDMNHTDDKQPKGLHDYCEPITGSRVCN